MAVRAIDDFVLADATLLRVDGPTVLFLRPRERVTLAVLDGMRKAVAVTAKRQRWPRRLRVVVLPAGWDLLALGDAELRKMGLVRITPTSE